MFNRKTLSLDYEKMEDAAIRKHRRSIIENSYINNYGVVHMRYGIEMLMRSSINILFSVILFMEMLSLLIGAVDGTGILLLGVLILCMIVKITLGFRYEKRMAKCYKEIGNFMLEENRMGNGFDVEGLDNRIYNQQQKIDQLYAAKNQRHLEVFTKIFHKETYNGSAPQIIAVKLSELCSYMLVCYYCVMHVFPIGSVIKYVGYLGKLADSIGAFFEAIGTLKENEQYLAVYLSYFDIHNDMYQGSLSVEKRSDKKFDIEFRNVSFRYAGSEKYALKNVNLNLNVGERLAVVGMNGSGKTTFIKLLCRLYDPTEGEIFMNDFNIRKYDYRQYLDIFSVVFQDYNLLALPLGNNIASAEHWDAAKAEALIEQVGFTERYAEMPQKLETPIYKNFDEDGVEISGGEAQKIALARALYKDSPFIILDEPTAALDPIAEAEIYSKFDAIAGDKTVIYISHRLSSCRFCDKIAVFHEGEIVQFGTHEELLRDETGKYYELWTAQAQYYT